MIVHDCTKKRNQKVNLNKERYNGDGAFPKHRADKALGQNG